MELYSLFSTPLIFKSASYVGPGLASFTVAHTEAPKLRANSLCV
jgi:hypothetical protein